MADGFRIADVYVRALLDRDQLRADIAGLPAELGGEADAAGQAVGDRMGRAASDGISRGIEDGVGSAPVAEPSTRKGTEAGDRFGSAMSSKVRAALAALPPADINLDDEYAQAKLDYIREELIGLGDAKVGVDLSDADAIAKLTVLRTELDELRTASASVQVKVDTAAASAQIDKFLADTEVKSEVAGDKVGKNLTDAAAKSAGGASPMIVSAIVGGLIAGGPAVAAASVLLFGGISAYAAKSNADVQASFGQLKTTVVGDLHDIGQQTSGEFTAALRDVRAGFLQVEPDIRSAMTAGAADVHSLVDALMSATDTVIPAFNRELQAGQPVVQGLDTLVRDLGSGVAGMLDQLSAHSGAEGQVLSEIGQTLKILLPDIGTLLGEGAELGSTVLPVVNTALQWTSDILHLIAPILPEVAAGFAGFKVVSLLSGPMGTLSAKMQTVAADADGLKGKLAGLGAQGAAGLSNTLPIIGIALAGVSAAFEKQSSDVQRWGQDLLDGGAKAAEAKQQIQALQGTSYELSHGLQGGIADLLGYGTALNVTSQSGQKAQQAAHDLYKSMSPLEQKQQDVTTAQNNLQAVLADPKHTAAQASAAADRLSTANSNLAIFQDQVKTATDNASTAQQTNATRLQDIANKASAASTQINLLKGALDALTGKQVTETEAEIGVTQATVAATTAVQGHTGALVDNNGKLTVNTDRGAAAQSALIQLAGASNQLIATMQQQGYTQDQVSAKDDELRQNFIRTAEQMGYNAGQAQQLADQLYGIPASRHTDITLGLPNWGAVDSSINWVARSRTVQIYGVFHGTNAIAGMNAAGGKVANTPLIHLGFDSGGKVSGPGGPTDDLVPALGPRSDVNYRLSPTEWIIKGSSSAKYGDYKMQAVNDGRAVITVPGPQPTQRYATGGSLGDAGSGEGITVQQLTVQVNIPAGTAVITDRDIPSTVVSALQQALLKKDRQRR